MSHFCLLELMSSSGESFPHWIILPEICYCVFGKSFTTDFMYVVLLAIHISNTYEIAPRINLRSSTHKLFNFIELDSVVSKITAFKIMSNFGGHTHSLSLSIYILYIYIYIYIYFFRKTRNLEIVFHF